MRIEEGMKVIYVGSGRSIVPKGCIGEVDTIADDTQHPIYVKWPGIGRLWCNGKNIMPYPSDNKDSGMKSIW